MIEIISYDAIEKKNILEGEIVQPLTSHESLIHCLDLLDFMAAFSKKEDENEMDGIHWTILEVKKHDQ